MGLSCHAVPLVQRFPKDWKTEIGHWLLTAQRLEFLDQVVHRVVCRVKQDKAVASDIDPNESWHKIMNQELAPAMWAHYLVGTGWAFDAWEPPEGDGVDVDVRLRPSDGNSTINIQAKAPDQPVRVVDSQIVAGENGAYVLQSIDKAVTQLPNPASRPSLVSVSSQWTFSASMQPCFITRQVIGEAVRTDNVLRIRRENSAHFLCDGWAHVGGIVVLDYVRGEDRFGHGCTVILNPSAAVEAHCHREWFPHAQVIWCDDARVRVQGHPFRLPLLPDGTLLGNPEFESS